MFTETLSQRQALASANLTTINSGGTASISTGALNMGILRRARAICQTGDVTGGASVILKLQASATADGSYTDISGAATTAVTTDNQLITVEISSDFMPAGKPFLRAMAINSGAFDAPVSVILIGDESGYKPGSGYGPATIAQAVVKGN